MIGAALERRVHSALLGQFDIAKALDEAVYVSRITGNFFQGTLLSLPPRVWEGYHVRASGAATND